MLQVRRFETDFEELPRHWYGGDPVTTHAVNALNLIFPDGERFFVRSVARFADRVTDPALQADVQAFIQQEAEHGRAHATQVEVLEAQGFEVREWLRGYREQIRRQERTLPARWNLAVTVALEHLTASFATFAFEKRFLDEAHPAMRDLLYWHAAEELEHRAVAFEVHRAAGGGWLERGIGMAIALATLVRHWRSATRTLMSQDPDVDRAKVEERTRELAAQGRTRGKLLRRSLLPYFSPWYDPATAHDGAPGVAYLRGKGLVASP